MMDVWILAGQSNMQGCGVLCDAALCLESASDERIWSFSTAGEWQIAQEPLHRLWESYTPVHQNFMRQHLTEDDKQLSNEEIAARDARDRTTGAGLGLAFAQSMADARGNAIGLIPAAHGGTTLEDWNFNRKDQGGASLYGAMLDRVRKARETADFKLRGVLWYQGESDCGEESASNYGERLEAWVGAMRADLGIADLPFIQVQLGRVLSAPSQAPDTFWQGRHWEAVREAQRNLSERVPNTATVSAIDLGLCDAIHIDTPGLIRLGKRMARLATDLKAVPRLKDVRSIPPQPNGFPRVQVRCEGVSGGWNPKTHLSGFEIRNAQNELHPDLFLIAVNVDAADPTSINLVLSGQPNDEVRIGYGLGLNPYCNTVDDADMPLPAFAPQPIATG
jgi:sialate O-acetylesterase